jgi:hypothetical protein
LKYRSNFTNYFTIRCIKRRIKVSAGIKVNYLSILFQSPENLKLQQHRTTEVDCIEDEDEEEEIDDVEEDEEVESGDEEEEEVSQLT